jgi:hypothetical protein
MLAILLIMKRLGIILAACVLLAFHHAPAAIGQDTPFAAVIDASTLTGKLMMGYQGWFLCPGDASPVNEWVHWFNNQRPSAASLTVEMWPDTSELDESELCALRICFRPIAPQR